MFETCLNLVLRSGAASLRLQANSAKHLGFFGTIQRFQTGSQAAAELLGPYAAVHSL
jgi:hypothetical protein